jgi:carboxymethylenebutenolidase
VSVEHEISIPLTEGHMPGWLSIPEGNGPWPGVVVIHEIFGVNDDMRRIAKHLADHGYVALLPDLFAPLGRAPLCVMRAITAVTRGEGESFAHLEAARAWLAARPEVDPTRSAVMGFCLGGGFALLFAARADVSAAAAFYGDVPKQASALSGICPVVGGFGARDRVFGPGGNRLVSHLEELGIEHDVKIYPDSGHSFMSNHEGALGWLGGVSPMHVGFDSEASQDSWSRVFAFFDRHLKKSSI